MPKIHGKHQGWIFTCNNYTDEDVLWCQTVDCQGIKVGKELAPTTGTPHLQGAIYWSNKDKKRLSGMRKFMGGRASWFVMEGSWADQKYCLKDGDVVRCEGDGPKQGMRQDLSSARDAVIAGANDRELIMDHVTVVARYRPFLEHVRATFREKLMPLDEDKFSKRMGIWVWSKESDLGKTTRFSKACPNFFKKESNKWWDNYDQEGIVLIDDLQPLWAGAFFGWMKQWVNLTPFTGECKGLRGGVQVRFCKLVVTCNKSPQDYFGEHYVESEFLSRFKVHHMGDFGDQKKAQQDVVALYKSFLEK